jgi:hypothetical protein
VRSQVIALVVFAHGSGSSRVGDRNLKVAQTLSSAGMARLLFDLLSPAGIGAQSCSRFDIRLLADRLTDAIEWANETLGNSITSFQSFGCGHGRSHSLRSGSGIRRSHQDCSVARWTTGPPWRSPGGRHCPYTPNGGWQRSWHYRIDPGGAWQIKKLNFDFINPRRDAFIQEAG